jgi:hypothetical protein
MSPDGEVLGLTTLRSKGKRSCFLVAPQQRRIIPDRLVTGCSRGSGQTRPERTMLNKRESQIILRPKLAALRANKETWHRTCRASYRSPQSPDYPLFPIPVAITLLILPLWD